MDRKQLNKEPGHFYGFPPTNWIISILERFEKWNPRQRQHFISRLRSKSLREEQKRECMLSPKLDCPLYDHVEHHRMPRDKRKTNTKGGS
jgi:hypothetical protein